MNIIVIENNDDLRQATVALLMRHGHWAIGLVSAKDLEDVQFSPPPELFLMDLNLPDEDGLNLTRRLRASRPFVAIIMVAGRFLLGDRLAGYNSGADIFLQKPVDPSELLAVVESLARRIHVDFSQKPFDSARTALCLAPASRLLHGPVADMQITKSEVTILMGLGGAKSGRMTFTEILALLGEDPSSCSQAALAVRIARLRQKLRRSGAPKGAIGSVRGIGYRLTVAINVV